MLRRNATGAAYGGGVQILDPDAWRPLEARHHAVVDEVVVPHLHRARTGVKHPVIDFLFTYYSQSPAKLRRWHPGWRLGLVTAPDDPRASWRFQRYDAGVASVDLPAFLDRHTRRLRDTRNLLSATAGRPAQYGCFGLHEWAMVYQSSPEELRHARWPLRLSRSETDQVMEAGQLRCTHFDAFRFFTPPAAPRNLTSLSRDSAVVNEQPGCLHAGMDLYKWAYLLTPAVDSELVWDAFQLAMEIRELDMQAAPYDLRDLGYEPVEIETASGRAEYVRRQRGFAGRGHAIRARLMAQIDAIAAAAAPSQTSAPSSRT